MKRSLLAVTLLACSSTTSSQPPPISGTGQPVAGGEISLALSGVTLADECGEAGRPPTEPPVAAAPQPALEGKRAPDGDMDRSCASEADCAASSAGRLACQQTSMQLVARLPAGMPGTTIRVKRVELLDEHGQVLTTLTARKPMRWGADSYVAWDETLAANQELAASYFLTTPDWATLSGGKWSAYSKRFDLRVTFLVGSDERTVEKQAVQPAMLEPMIET